MRTFFITNSCVFIQTCLRKISLIIFLIIPGFVYSQIHPYQIGFPPDSSTLWMLGTDTLSSSPTYGQGMWYDLIALMDSLDIGSGVTDHGALTGLADDDHPQYALLAGRSAGQTLTGGTTTTADLSFKTTSAAGAAGADMHFLVGNNGTKEALTILNDGKIGINRINPDHPVHVFDSINSTLNIAIDNRGSGNNASAQLSVLTSTSGGFFGAFDAGHAQSGWADRAMFGSYSAASGITVAAYGSNQDIRFIANGTNSERMRILSTGNVAIGTTSASARLHVFSTTEQLRTSYNSSNYFSTTVGSNGLTTFNAEGTAPSFSFSDNIGIGVTPLARLHSQSTLEQLRLSYDGSNYVSTTIANNGLATMDGTGAGAAFLFNDKLGYNTNGATPTTLSGRDGTYFSDVVTGFGLDLVSGTLKIDTTEIATQYDLSFVSGGGSDHGSLSGLSDDDHSQYALLAGRTGGQALFGGTATIDDLTFQTTSGNGVTGSDMHFRTGLDGGTEALTILNNGNVGIGTSEPFSRLLTLGDIGALSPNTTSAGSPIGGSLYLGDGNYNNSGYFNKGPGLSAVYNANQSVASDLAIYSYSGNRLERMRVLYNGNIGIGTSAPDKKMELNLISSTDALRMSYNDADGSAATFTDFTIGSNGNVGFDATGSAPSFLFNDKLGYTTNGASPTTLSGRDGTYFSDVNEGYGLNLTSGALSVDTTQMATQHDLLGLGGGTEDPDNEGILGVKSISSTTAVITSNTVGALGDTLIVSSGLSLAANTNLNGGTITITNTGDTNASDDLTTSTNFSGDVSGTYNTINLNANVVGSNELSSTTVTPGTYENASITVDADGRITAARGATYYYITATQTTTSTLGANITGLSFTPQGNKRYVITGYINGRSTAATTGVRIAIKWPSGIIDNSGVVTGSNSTTAVAQALNAGTATVFAPTISVSAAGVTQLNWVNAYMFMNTVTSGTFQMMFASETGTQVSVEPGSYIKVEELPF